MKIINNLGANSMNKNTMKELLKSAAENIKLVNVYFRFDPNYYNLIPLVLEDKLFLAINEFDFLFDGYSICRFKDMTKVKIKNDMCDEIIKNEGLTSSIVTPNINIYSWKTVFESLKSLNRNILIKKQTFDCKDVELDIVRIERIHTNFAYVWILGDNGIWDDSPTKVFYSQIANITFASRCVDIPSKYLNEPPFIK